MEDSTSSHARDAVDNTESEVEMNEENENVNEDEHVENVNAEYEEDEVEDEVEEEDEEYGEFEEDDDLHELGEEEEGEGGGIIDLLFHHLVTHPAEDPEDTNPINFDTSLPSMYPIQR